MLFLSISKIDQLVWIFLQVVKEFLRRLVGPVDEVARVAHVPAPNAFPAGDASRDRQEFAEEVGAPVAHFVATNERGEAATGVRVRGGEPGQFDEGGADIAVQRHFRENAPLFGFGQARIVNHERHAEGLIIVGPLAGEAAITKVVTVVRGVNDDGVIGEALFFELFDEAANNMVDAADHAKVGPHVGLIFFRRVPAPEEALTIDGFLEEVGLRFVDRRIVERRQGHFLVLIHPVGDLGPGEVTDAGALVTVFGVGGVEADLEAEGLVPGLLLDEVNAPVAENLGLMTRAAVLHFLEEGAAKKLLSHIPHQGGRFIGDVDVFLAEVAGAVAGILQHGEEGSFAEFRIERPRLGAVEVTPLVGAGEEAGAADPASGGGDKGILKADPFPGEAVDVRCLDDGVARATEGVVALVVCVEKQNIGAGGVLVRGSGLFLRGCPFTLSRWSGLDFPFRFPVGRPLFRLNFRDLADLSLVRDIPFIEQGAERFNFLRLIAGKIGLFVRIFLQVVELRLATLGWVFHFARSPVVSQKQLVVAFDDPTVEEGGLGILDVRNVMRERLAVEGVTIDGITALQFREQVETRKVMRSFSIRSGKDGGHDINRGTKLRTVRSGNSARPAEHNGVAGAAFVRAALGTVGVAACLGLNPAVVSHIDNEGVFGNAGVIEFLHQEPDGVVEALDVGVVFGNAFVNALGLILGGQVLGRIVRGVWQERGIPDEEGFFVAHRAIDEVEDGFHALATDLETVVPVAATLVGITTSHTLGETTALVGAFPPFATLVADITFLTEPFGDGTDPVDVGDE